MKTKLLLLFTGLLIITIVTCKSKDDKAKSDRQFISKIIEYDVPINNCRDSYSDCFEKNEDWCRNNIEASSRLAYLDLLVMNALKGKLDLYNMDDKPIDTIALKKILFITDTVKLTMTEPPYRSFDTVITKNFDAHRITKLRFREEWSYDAENLTLTKKVKDMAVLVTPPAEYDSKNNEIIGKDKALFRIKFSKEIENPKLLTKRIISAVDYKEYSIYNTTGEVSEFIIKYNKYLLEKVSIDKIKAYSPSSFLASERFSGKELVKSDSVFDKSKNKMIVVKKVIGDIKTIRFLEEWYFDPLSMAIQKKVVGVCPIQDCFDQNGEFMGRKPFFWVYFSDIWMPFDEKIEIK